MKSLNTHINESIVADRYLKRDKKMRDTVSSIADDLASKPEISKLRKKHFDDIKKLVKNYNLKFGDVELDSDDIDIVVNRVIKSSKKIM